jgi:hypothetical protein
MMLVRQEPLRTGARAGVRFAMLLGALMVPAVSIAAGSQHSVDMTWKGSQLTRTAGGAAFDHGSASGSPLGTGHVHIKTPRTPAQPLHAHFVINSRSGSVSGTLTLRLKLVSSSASTLVLSVHGRGRITSGKEKFAGADGELTSVDGRTTSTTICRTSGPCSYREQWKLHVRGRVSY